MVEMTNELKTKVSKLEGTLQYYIKKSKAMARVTVVKRIKLTEETNKNAINSVCTNPVLKTFLKSYLSRTAN